MKDNENKIHVPLSMVNELIKAVRDMDSNKIQATDFNNIIDNIFKKNQFDFIPKIKRNCNKLYIEIGVVSKDIVENLILKAERFLNSTSEWNANKLEETIKETKENF